MGLTLTPGQYAWTSVAYDGCWPTESVHQRIAEQIFGGEIDDGYHSVILGIFGARGGKSYVLGAARMLHGALVRKLDKLGHGERAYGPVVGPGLDHAYQVLRYVRGLITTKPELEALIDVDVADEIGLRRPDGVCVSIKAYAASRGGTSVRGKSFFDALMDEAAFFMDASFKVNDEEIFNAITPRIVEGGQTMLYTTAWAESGLAYSLFTEGTTEHVLVGRAPTLLMHDTPEKRRVIEMQTARDPINAAREYGAEFLSIGTGQYFNPTAIRNATRNYEIESCIRTNRYRYACGIDLGFRSDSSALVVVEFNGDTYRVCAVHELSPSKEGPLKPSEVVAAFSEVAKRFGCTHVISDGHYREAILEHLTNEKLGLIDALPGATGKTESYSRAKAVLHEGQCVLPEHPRLLQQLREVVSRPTPGGGLSITSPRKPGGGHGDLVSAWVLAVHYLATARVEPLEPNAPTYGTRDYDVFMFEKQRKDMIGSLERKYGKQPDEDWYDGD